MLGKEKRRKFAKVLGTFGKANSGGTGASTPSALEAGAVKSPTDVNAITRIHDSLTFLGAT